MGADAMAVGTPLRVRVLGDFAVDGVPDRSLGSRKARTLLKRLALARGLPVSTAALVDAVWGDAPPASPDDQLAVLVSRLRRVLGRERLTRTSAGFGFAADWLDADELAALVERADAALRDGHVGAARAAADAALRLARGPLLGDEDADWLAPDRALAESLVRRATGLAAAAALAAGDHTAAIVAAEAQLARDPYDESALRVLMRAHVAERRPASGLAAYARVRARLADDLGVSPAPETEQLHTAVLLGEPSPLGAWVAPPVAAGRFVGRVGELAALEAHLAAATAAVRVVQVEGEPGIGKSALVRRFAQLAAARGVRVVHAATDDLGRDLPLQPLIDAVGLIPPTRDRRTRAVWYHDALARIGTGAALAVLIVDDAHRADPATREFLEWMPGQAAAVLVVTTTRPAARLNGAAVLSLGPLGVDEVAALVGADIAQARLAAVHARSAGNPLFALAIAAAGDGELPASVQEAVTNTLGPLRSEDTDVVQAAAVLGGEVDVDLLAAVLRRPALAVLGVLETAAASGVLTERGAGFAFRHDIVREVLEAGAGEARAALLHRTAAAVLAERPHADALAVAVHARLGGDDNRAGAAYVVAARTSLGRGDVVAAETYLRSALACGERAAHTELARVLVTVGRLDEAAEEAAAGVAAAGDAGALETAGWVAYYRRDYMAAQRFSDTAAERAADPLVRAGALALGGRVRHGYGDLMGAEQRLVAALDGGPDTKAVAQVWLAQVALHRGDPQAAGALAEAALVDPAHHAHPFSPFHGAFALTAALGYQGRVGEALVALDRFADAVVRAGSLGARFTAVPDNLRAWLLRNTGRIGEADVAAQQALELNGAGDGSGPAEGGFAEAYWVALMELADGCLVAGDLSRAETLVDKLAAIDTWHGTMAWHQRHRRDLIVARWARATGDRAQSAELAARVAGDAGARGAGRYAALAQAELALATGDTDPTTLDVVLTELDRSAGLEAWRLTLELSERFGVTAWRHRAELAAGRLVLTVPHAHRDAAHAAVAQAFS